MGRGRKVRVDTGGQTQQAATQNEYTIALDLFEYIFYESCIGNMNLEICT